MIVSFDWLRNETIIANGGGPNCLVNYKISAIARQKFVWSAGLFPAEPMGMK